MTRLVALHFTLNVANVERELGSTVVEPQWHAIRFEGGKRGSSGKRNPHRLRRIGIGPAIL